jgi:hypothetical protein
MVEGSRDGNCILFADLLPILTKHGLEVSFHRLFIRLPVLPKL